MPWVSGGGSRLVLAKKGRFPDYLGIRDQANEDKSLYQVVVLVGDFCRANKRHHWPLQKLSANVRFPDFGTEGKNAR